MRLQTIIRPFVFTKAELFDRGYHWVAEWLGLFATLIYLITLGYYEPCWKFGFLTYIRNKTYKPTYDNQAPMDPR